MNLNRYRNYRVCSCCGTSLPLSRKFFKRNNEEDGSTSFHEICRECEDNKMQEHEWQNGKLLCHYCNEYKDINEFSANGSKSRVRNGRRYICRQCGTTRQKKHNKALPDEQKLDKCLRWRWLGAKDRSKRNNIDFSLTFEDIKNLWITQNGICALSGIKMTYELQNGRTPTNVSIDKIDHTKGYIAGNVQLVCMACNQIKSDLSEEEMYQFCKKIVEHYESKNNKSTR